MSYEKMDIGKERMIDPMDGPFRTKYLVLFTGIPILFLFNGVMLWIISTIDPFPLKIPTISIMIGGNIFMVPTLMIFKMTRLGYDLEPGNKSQTDWKVKEMRKRNQNSYQMENRTPDYFPLFYIMGLLLIMWPFFYLDIFISILITLIILAHIIAISFMNKKKIQDAKRKMDNPEWVFFQDGCLFLRPPSESSFERMLQKMEIEIPIEKIDKVVWSTNLQAEYRKVHLKLKNDTYRVIQQDDIKDEAEFKELLKAQYHEKFVKTNILFNVFKDL